MTSANLLAATLSAMPDDQLSNAATELVRFVMATFRVAGVTNDVVPVTDDFYADDRRSGVSFGKLDGPDWVAYLATNAEVGSGQTNMSVTEVIGVRGERSAAFCWLSDYGDDRRTDAIACTRLDSNLSAFERMVYFDLADREAALGELDRLHAEVNGEPERP